MSVKITHYLPQQNRKHRPTREEVLAFLMRSVSEPRGGSLAHGVRPFPATVFRRFIEEAPSVALINKPTTHSPADRPSDGRRCVELLMFYMTNVGARSLWRPGHTDVVIDVRFCLTDRSEQMLLLHHVLLPASGSGENAIGFSASFLFS